MDGPIPGNIPLPDSTTSILTGSLVITAHISILLCGINLSQCYAYFRAFPGDKPWLKVAVTTVLLMELAHFCMITALVYDKLAVGWGNVMSFGLLTPPYVVHCFITAIDHTAVQAVFIHRVKTLTRSNMLAIACLLFLGANSAASGVLGVGIILMIGKPIPTHLLSGSWFPVHVLIPAVGTAGDILVTLSLGLHLWKHRRSTITSRQPAVNKMIVCLIETGLLTSLSSLFYFVTLLAFRQNYEWSGIAYIVPRLYSFSLLVSLNNRKKLREMMTNTAPISLLWSAPTSSSSLAFAHPDRPPTTFDPNSELDRENQTKSMRSRLDVQDGALIESTC